jgi:hypothetical protein
MILGKYRYVALGFICAEVVFGIMSKTINNFHLAVIGALILIAGCIEDLRS